MSKGDVLEDDDRVLGRVLLQQVLEVGGASTQDHLVSFSVLTLEKAVEREQYFLFNSLFFFVITILK